ncbi:hypothetical protein LPJ57_005413 [Coemansia sp. RSA 486]|nr:hypothetical protein LPJ57_005413 [Coemansia sp. RSA 486]
MSQQQRQKMMMRRRQKMSQQLAQEQEKLKEQLNLIYSEDILNIARHFGNKREATAAQVTDIDNKAITIQWEWTEKGGKKSTDEMQFAFREAASAGSAIQEISDLASEAHKALGVATKPQLTKDKEALEARTLVNFAFKPPSVVVMVAVLFGLFATGYLAFVEDLHPPLGFVRSYVSRLTCYYFFVIVIGLHVLEALAVFSVCQLIKTFQPRQMTTETQIKWTIGGALFGMFCLHEFIARIMRQFDIAENMKAPSLSQRGYGKEE